jgi:SAM-dependent methyltransferase
MQIRPAEIVSFFCCPDDGAALAAESDKFVCSRCARLFSILDGNTLDLLPSEPFFLEMGRVSPVYWKGYRKEFNRAFILGDGSKAWGACDGMSRRFERLRKRQTEEVLQFLWKEQPCSEGVFCDLSAGAGHVTLEAARRSRIVFHCDLSLDSLAYVRNKARKADITNMVFVRADYFQPPFRGFVDSLACLDTLIRGTWHESRLLKSIQQVLAPTGVAVVDFHNWWHNPLRRIGLLRDNFSGNKSYSIRELKRLLAASGISQLGMRGFVQEVDSARVPGKILSRLIPPTRIMVRLAAESVPYVSERAASFSERVA